MRSFKDRMSERSRELGEQQVKDAETGDRLNVGARELASEIEKYRGELGITDLSVSTLDNQVTLKGPKGTLIATVQEVGKYSVVTNSGDGLSVSRPIQEYFEADT